MSRHSKRRKHAPQRTCIACRALRPKRDLVRIVRLSASEEEGRVVVDETGKRNGRGAYLCRQQECWEKALARQQLERALRVTLTEKDRAYLREYASGLPQHLATRPEGTEETAERKV